GIVESNWWKKNQTKPKVNLAPQQLVDCDTGNGGCNGGWYEAALRYTIANGIVPETNYPYKGVKGTCRIPSTAPRTKITNFSYCDSCTIDQWWSLFHQGPIAIAVD
ncbi:MAG: C1 family peptidase, partial [Flammeovirgaceae bacterium]